LQLATSTGRNQNAAMQFHRRLVGVGLATSVATACVGHAATTTWRIDTLDPIDGHRSRIIGNPIVTEDRDHRVVQFDGVGDGILVPANPLAGWPVFTVEILFRPETSGSFEQRFLHLGLPTGARGLIELRLTPEHQWYLDTYLESGVGKLALIDPAKLHPAGTWYWVALRYDGRVMSHFVNGVMERSGELEIPPLPAGETSLGVRQTLVSWFHGAIGEVRFHDTALAPEDLQRIE